MQPHDFDVTVSYEDHEVLVDVRGEVDLYTGPMLWDRMSAAVDGGPRRVVMDIGGVSFMDSTGISVIVMALRRLREDGGVLVVRSPSRSIFKLLELTGVASLVTVEGDVTVAA